MAKIIWLIDSDRGSLLDGQRKINSDGSMRTICMLSFDALKSKIEKLNIADYESQEAPCLIIVDYDTVNNEIITAIRKNNMLSGVPVFFSVNTRTAEKDEICYDLGAMVVLEKPFNSAAIKRIERMALSYDNTRSYEKLISRQLIQVQNAKKIQKLNEQLSDRNEFLYQVFGKYFSDDVLKQILDNPQGAMIGGVKKELTIMVADLRGFTSIAQKLSSDSLTKMLNFYFSQMVEVIQAYHGTVIEFMGDGVLAVFGGVLDTDTHKKDAVTAAILMQNAMNLVNQFCAENSFPILKMGIGIHTGNTFIGNVGSEKMMRYNVLGSSVNVCSRIEGCTIGGQVFTSAKVLEGLEDIVKIKSRNYISLKGVSEPVEVCEIYGINREMDIYLKTIETEKIKPVDSEIKVILLPIVNKSVGNIETKGVISGISSTDITVILKAPTDKLSLYQDYVLKGDISCTCVKVVSSEANKSTLKILGQVSDNTKEEIYLSLLS